MSSSTIVAVIGLILIAAYFVWRRFSDTIASPTDPDAEVLDKLRRAGSNLREPHRIEFFLYLPTQQAADTVREQLSLMGFSAEVMKAATGSDWLCEATREMLPTHSELVKMRTELSTLAEKFGGNYDGWGTPMVE